MKILRLDDFEGTGFEELSSFIMQTPDNTFEIYINKRYSAVPEAHTLYQNYAVATFIGQKLLTIGQQFTYRVPANDIHDPFVFQVTVSDNAELSDLLQCILACFINYYNSELNKKFIYTALNCFENGYYETQSEACWGLIVIAKHYIAKTQRSNRRKERIEKSDIKKKQYFFLTIK